MPDNTMMNPPYCNLCGEDTALGNCDCPYTLHEMLRAMCVMGNHYHSGQWSKGYRMLCQASLYLLREYENGYPTEERHLTDRELQLHCTLVNLHEKEL